MVTPFKVYFHNTGAQPINNNNKVISFGKAGKPRLHFKSQALKSQHDVALKNFRVIAESEDGNKPRLSCRERWKYALLRVKGEDQDNNKIDGWVKVNRSSVAKRFGFKRKNVTGDVTHLLHKVIRKNHKRKRRVGFEIDSAEAENHTRRSGSRKRPRRNKVKVRIPNRDPETNKVKPSKNQIQADC